MYTYIHVHTICHVSLSLHTRIIRHRLPHSERAARNSEPHARVISCVRWRGARTSAPPAAPTQCPVRAQRAHPCIQSHIQPHQSVCTMSEMFTNIMLGERRLHTTHAFMLLPVPRCTRGAFCVCVCVCVCMLARLPPPVPQTTPSMREIPAVCVCARLCLPGVCEGTRNIVVNGFGILALMGRGPFEDCRRPGGHTHTHTPEEKCGRRGGRRVSKGNRARSRLAAPSAMQDELTNRHRGLFNGPPPHNQLTSGCSVRGVSRVYLLWRCYARDRARCPLCFHSH